MGRGELPAVVLLGEADAACGELTEQMDDGLVMSLIESGGVDDIHNLC